MGLGFPEGVSRHRPAFGGSNPQLRILIGSRSLLRGRFVLPREYLAGSSGCTGKTDSILDQRGAEVQRKTAIRRRKTPFCTSVVDQKKRPRCRPKKVPKLYVENRF